MPTLTVFQRNLHALAQDAEAKGEHKLSEMYKAVLVRDLERPRVKVEHMLSERDYARIKCGVRL